jgi:hypothetical protein
MTRSALIVGLGGTGQWVLTYLKKDLIESNGGEMPENVKLLAFDYMPEASVSADTATTDTGKEVKVGGVRLKTNTEFIYLGGDMRNIGVTLTSPDPERRQSLSHIGSWFAAQHWMHALPTASWTLSSGAGKLRQFGRLGLFQDLRDIGKSKIWNAIYSAVSSLRKNSGGQKLEIVIVGSFAGGTGSGMFIDLALLLREVTQGANSLVRGYFALPRVFDQNPDDDLMARSFAAWRELNRFMTVSSEFPMPALIYNPQDKRLQIKRINHRLYDACYLIDGKQEDTQINVNPEVIIFPAIADAISALLDDTAGGHYTEYVGTNLAEVYAKKPGTPLYSAVGAHSFKVPVYYAQQEFSYQLTAELLETLIKPLRDDIKNPNRITGVSPTSPSDPARIGRMDAAHLLTRDYAYMGNSEQTTLFTKRISDILNEGGTTNLPLVEAFAAGSLSVAQSRGRTWLKEFTELENRQDLQELRSEIQRVTSLQLAKSIKTSKEIDEDPRNGPRRFDANIPGFVAQNYGGRDASGNDYGGLFGDALEKARAIQVDIFQRNAQYWLLNTLMGEDPEDPIRSKGGRIGYAYDLLDGLVNLFGRFLDFMKAVDEKRTGAEQPVQPRLKAEETRNRIKTEMIKESTRRIPLVGPHPKAHSSQERYLRAEQQVVDIRKDELLHKHIEAAARDMRQAATTLRDELGRWIMMLATGDPATGVTGLSELIETQRLLVRNTANADANLASQTTIPGPDYQQDQGELKRLMRAVKWQIDSTAADFRLRLSIESEDEGSTEFERTTGKERAEMRTNLTQRNLSKVLDYAKRRFSRLPGETRIAQRLAEEYGYDATEFVNRTRKKALPFFERTNDGSSGGAAKWAYLVRISLDRDKLEQKTFDFVREIELEMRRQEQVDIERDDQDRLVKIVGSADPHKCTFVYTDDLYEVNLFKAWEDCQNAYLNNSQFPPYLQHNFPAETNAAQFESEIVTRWNRKYQVLHPWVVMLLEHRDRFEHFLILQALGWFKLNRNGRLESFELNLPSDPYPFTLTVPSNKRPSLFQLMHSFILVGEDKAPGTSRTIDYEEIARIIHNEEDLLNDQVWIDMLTVMLKKGRGKEVSTAWIDQQMEELTQEYNRNKILHKDEPADYVKAYSDLSAVAALTIEGLIAEKQRRIKPSSFA